MKKIFLFIFLGSLLFSPLISLAGDYLIDGKTIHYEGVVPCGKDERALAPGESFEVTYPCQLCHFFVMFEGIIDFILFRIVPVVAVLMLVIGGVMFFFAGGNLTALSKAKKILTSTVIGLAIIFLAWILINSILSVIGLSDFGLELTGPDKWNQIDCGIQLSQ